MDQTYWDMMQLTVQQKEHAAQLLWCKGIM